MGCPNKIQDQRIIAEVERRKAMIPAEPLQTIWDGPLPELFQSGIEIENIQKIERMGTIWIIDLKE